MRIIIIDDDPIVAESLTLIIEKGDARIRVLAQGKSGQEAIALYRQYQPDLLLLDIQMPEMDGLEAGKLILEEFPQAKLLYLTTFLNNEYIITALRIGARGYLMKSSVKQLVPALLAIYSGQRVFGDEIVDKFTLDTSSGTKRNQNIARPIAPHSKFHKLNEKEWKIVQLIAEGMNNKEIAQHLHFSEGTIRNYLSIILEKMEIRDRTQLAVYYYKNLLEY